MFSNEHSQGNVRNETTSKYVGRRRRWRLNPHRWVNTVDAKGAQDCWLYVSLESCLGGKRFPKGCVGGVQECNSGRNGGALGKHPLTKYQLQVWEDCERRAPPQVRMSQAATPNFGKGWACFTQTSYFQKTWKGGLKSFRILVRGLFEAPLKIHKTLCCEGSDGNWEANGKMKGWKETSFGSSAIFVIRHCLEFAPPRVHTFPLIVTLYSDGTTIQCKIFHPRGISTVRTCT